MSIQRGRETGARRCCARAAALRHSLRCCSHRWLWQQSGQPSRRWSERLVWVLAVWLPLSSIGCSRTFWRKQADRDSYEAIQENLTDPRWAVPRIDITPDPRSRFYNPYSPDEEPLPPDDPHAHVYMHWVDGWQGYKRWHEFGDLMSVENPQWLAPFGLSAEDIDPETGEYVQPLPEIDNLTLCEALELALIHNRDYQTQLEIVFLRALEVTAERYQFSVRYLTRGRQTPGGDATASFSPDGGTDSFSLGSRFGVSQLLPTGGQWFVELVNNTIWLFDGPNQTQTASTLAFALTQPLLFQAGRKIVLENLTQTERNLLYAVRDLARFRREFFTDIVGGGSGQVGYLGLLRQLQEIRNTESNIFRLEEQVEILKETSSQRPRPTRETLEVLPPELAEIPDALRDFLIYNADRRELIWLGPMTDAQAEQLQELSDNRAYQRAINEIIQSLRTETVTLDVLQLQSRLADTVNTLRSQEAALADSLDAFKVFLGLRTDFLVTLDDKLLNQFQFLDERLLELERNASSKAFGPIWGQLDEDEPDREQFKEVALRLKDLLRDAEENGLAVIREDFRRLEPIYRRRMQEGEPEVRQRLAYDVQRDRRLFDDAAYQISLLLQKTEEVLHQLDDPTVPIGQVKGWVTDIKDFQEDLSTLVGTLEAVQIGLRVEIVSNEEFDIPMDQAVAIGLENRLDLKNARAIVMDARRRVEVAANALRSNLDAVVEGDINTPGPFGNTDPFEFRGDISDLRIGVAFDSPLDLNRERNTYRAALIDYQRARRDYMLFEDRVKQDIRTAWRQLRVLDKNLETARQSIRIAAAQFDSAVAQAFAPAGPGQGPSRTAGLSGQNIQRALDAVLRAQNSMIRIWVSYEQNRLNIYRDMGIMEVGSDNIWNDPFYRELCRGVAGDCPDAFPPAFSDAPHGSDERVEPSPGPEFGSAGSPPLRDSEPAAGVQ